MKPFSNNAEPKERERETQTRGEREDETQPESGRTKRDPKRAEVKRQEKVLP
jgi:hypothetical protein